jgi:hypothetical protein
MSGGKGSPPTIDGLPAALVRGFRSKADVQAALLLARPEGTELRVKRGGNKTKVSFECCHGSACEVSRCVFCCSAATSLSACAAAVHGSCSTEGRDVGDLGRFGSSAAHLSEADDAGARAWRSQAGSQRACRGGGVAAEWTELLPAVRRLQRARVTADSEGLNSDGHQTRCRVACAGDHAVGVRRAAFARVRAATSGV